MASKRSGSNRHDVKEELYFVICRNGGVMELGAAVAMLSKPSRNLVRQSGAMNFVRTQNIFKVEQDGSRVSVEAILPWVFCPQAKEKNGCLNRDCKMLHLCPYFIKGTCSYKEQCRSSHNMRDEHTMSVLRRYNLDSLDNETLQKLMKKVVDDTESERAADNNPIPDICKFYNHIKGCTKRDKCPFLHVCQHFVDDTCKFAKKCKRVHHFKDQHNVDVLSNHGLQGLQQPMVLHILSGRQRTRTTSSSSDTPDIPTPVRKSSTPLVSLPGNASHGAAMNAPCIKDSEEAFICGFNLRGHCNYSNRCMHHHTELPYLWQWKDPSASWESLTSDVSMMVEQAFCDINKDSYGLILNGDPYCIKFDDMAAVPSSPMPNVPKLAIRRLSTQSSVDAAPGHIFSTRWYWYWLDGKNTWQSYDSPDAGVVPNTTFRQSLEKDFLAGAASHPFSAGSFTYTLNYKRMHQKNNQTKAKRPVRRRPEFVAKKDMKEVAKRRKAAYTVAVSAAIGDVAGASAVLPTHWDPMPADKDYHSVPLSTVSEEYKKAEKQFQSSLASDPKRVVKIERIQNPDLWMQFAQKRARMQKKARKVPEERSLFHGTSSEVVEAICQQGFDWRMCGKHGTAYGKGSYFACTASYSHRYTSAPASHSFFGFLRSSEKHMFLAKVLVGSYTTGNSSTVRPPPKDPSTPHGDLYDSCVNEIGNPGLFVVFDNSQAYPEYLITYM